MPKIIARNGVFNLLPKLFWLTVRKRFEIRGWRSQQFLVTDCFFTCSWSSLRYDKLGLLEFKLKKKILGFRNMQEKLEKWTVPTKMPKPAFTCSFFVCIEFNRCSKMSRPGPTKNKTLSAKQTSGLPFWKKREKLLMFWPQNDCLGSLCLFTTF